MHEPVCRIREVASSVPNLGAHCHLLAMTWPETLECRALRGTSKFTKIVIARRIAENQD